MDADLQHLPSLIPERIHYYRLGYDQVIPKQISLQEYNRFSKGLFSWIAFNVPAYFPIISSILVIGGIQLIFLSVIGEYIGRNESKRRSHYIIEEENITQQQTMEKQKKRCR